MVQKAKKLSRKKKRLIVVIFAFALLVLAAGYTVFIAPLLEKEEWAYKEAVVERGTLTVGVTESGSLEYGISNVMYELDLDVGDEEDTEDEDDGDDRTTQKYLRISEIYAAAGQRVEAGDALLKFEEDSVADVRRLLDSARVDAVSEYREAESEYNLSVLEAETTLQADTVTGNYASSIYGSAAADAKNQISLIQVEINQRNANMASLEEKVAEAQESYDEVAEEYRQAKEALDSVGTDNTVNYMSVQSGYLSAQSRYQNALNALTQATQNLEDNTRAITTLMNELTAAKAANAINQLDVEETYQESVIGGENAQITYQAKLESLKETLAEAEEEKEQADSRLQEFEDFVGTDGILYAPESGIITSVSYEVGDRLVTNGRILSYATADNMSISVDVTQEDVVDLAVGDSVDIYFSAYPDVLYQGQIQSIDTTATARNSNTISYVVVIAVLGDTSALYGGMTADIIFVTERLEDVLYVSRKAIVEQNGKTYVYKKSALGSRELTEVEIGISNGVNVEILSGLEEGDTIYLASRVSSAEEIQQSGEENSQSQAVGGMPDGDFQMPEGFEMPDGDFQMPEGFEMPGGDFQMPGGGQMPPNFGSGR
ncbi:MAG: HlyD family efflux transporter periplasmic adaptor subunit [Lachnospiraceae bacterium]|nr:HlyD family efflux transporter periplasmic adaptor subunit [Muribaculaceae bacterium]MCM1411887.1 HlyD family efflux transporter periplasmic adaptor subunit [Lachnospiraceae bacterium]